MKILLAVDGSDYTGKMLDYVTRQPLFDQQHDYTLFNAQPPLHFELDFVTRGVASITLVYRNQHGNRATEVLFFNAEGQVTHGVAHYSPGAASSAGSGAASG